MGVERGLAEDLGDLVAVNARGLGGFLVELAVLGPGDPAGELRGRERGVQKRGGGAVDVPVGAARIVVVGENALERADQRGDGDAGFVGDLVAAAEDAVDAAVGREEVGPPGEVEVFESIHGQEAQVDVFGAGEADGDELAEERVEIGAAFEDIFVEGRALLAGEAAEGDEEGAVGGAGFGEGGGEVGAPDDFVEGGGELGLGRGGEDGAPVCGGGGGGARGDEGGGGCGNDDEKSGSGEEADDGLHDDSSSCDTSSCWEMSLSFLLSGKRRRVGVLRMIWLRTLVFTLVVPGTVLVLAPLALARSGWGPRLDIGHARLLGVVPLGVGIAIIVVCFVEFILRGRGTPAPYDPPRQLVAGGLYRYVRNPQYVGVFLVAFGEALMSGAVILLAYTGFLMIAYNLHVRYYEEPTLTRTFGEAYARYCETVPRWWPRWRGAGEGRA